MKKPNGYIIHEDSSRVAIATGFRRKSTNRKTGPVIQIWVLVRSEDPLQAVASGKDRLICGSCPLRGAKGQSRACYVNLGKAPRSIWKAYKSGAYPLLTDYSVFAGRTVRLGAYGDPTHIPYELARRVVNAAQGHTGYTHQWRKPSFQPWRTLVMASVETDADRAQAQALGWSTFQVVPKDTKSPSPSIECLSDSKGVQCHDCLLCSGTRNTPRSIYIEAHGSGAKYVSKN